ncbi:MAG: LamG domain-containing protein, partial [Planctomycetota bacterium]|nr:LamG domain-containing protein [Planctomycetota bacterium]
IWDGGEYVFRLTVTESPGKGCVVNLGACRPKKENFWAKPTQHLPGNPRDLFKMRLNCVQGMVTGEVANKAGGSVSIGREQILFEPRFIGLFVRTNDGGENATAAFHSVRIVGMPNLEVIRQTAANQRVSAVPAARADLIKRAGEARAAANPEKGGALRAAPRGTADGKVGKAFECNGRDTFLDTPHDQALEPLQLTLGAWVYLDEFPRDGDGRRWVVDKNVHEEQNGHYALIIQHDHAGAYLNIGGGGNNRFLLTSASGSLKAKTWHHLALTYDGIEMKLYLDGVVVSSRSIKRPRQPGDRPFTIGRRQDGQLAFQGRVDEVRLYNRALSQNELSIYVLYPMLASTDGLIAYWSFDGN